MEIGNRNCLGDVVNDARIVPHDLGRQRTGADGHSVDTVVRQPVVADQRTLVAKIASELVEWAGRPTRVVDQQMIQRINVDADRWSIGIVSNDVADDRGLGTSNEDRSRRVITAAKSRIKGICVRFDPTCIE